jgi:hypothetical protein
VRSRRKAGFLGDREYPFDQPPTRAPPRRTRQTAPPAPPHEDALAYHHEEAKDDSDDFVACVFHDWQAAMAEGRKFNLPATMTHKEIESLGVLMSEVDRPVQPPLPQYATDIMPQG